ncbi:MAG: HAMP domain-containing histidine kinase [Clostridiales bacterium]|nr:HAMP domain-containing histidine kinase [Clostridiales bacterium]
MIKERLHRMRLSLVFSLVVLGIFLITSVIMIAIAFLFSHFGVVDKLGLKRSLPVLLAAFPASAIVGTIVSLVVGRIPLRPIRQVINATNRLAAGDFSVRISVSHTPEFRELRDSFNRMARELSSIELLRTDFINQFSHEFKTPIVSIKGFAELLKADDLPREERDEYLDIIIRESARLSAMATNVLNLTRVENQAIIPDQQDIDLGELLRRAVLLMQTAWERKKLCMEIELDEAKVRGNPEMLSQVWVNLLDNAVKFSQEGGAVTLTLRRDERWAAVTLRDEGQGIAPEDLPHIFDKFYQSETTRNIPGNGLGLTLAQRIVQMHGGEIACESSPGEWTAFTVRLPLLR